jgi:hypothetical protein
MRGAYQENVEARMSNVEGNPNAQMTKLRREMFCRSNFPCCVVGAHGQVIASSVVIDFQLSISTRYLLFVARRCRVVTICAPGSARRDRIGE